MLVTYLLQFIFAVIAVQLFKVSRSSFNARCCLAGQPPNQIIAGALVLKQDECPVVYLAGPIHPLPTGPPVLTRLLAGSPFRVVLCIRCSNLENFRKLSKPSLKCF